MFDSKKDPLSAIVDSCDLCWNNTTKNVSDQHFFLTNEQERKQFIKDMERAGVSLPLAEFETALRKTLMDDSTQAGETTNGTIDDLSMKSPWSDDVLRERVASVISEQVTADDYATNVPEDIKNMLRRMYAEDERLQNERTKDVYLGNISSTGNSRWWSRFRRSQDDSSTTSNKNTFASARLKRNCLGIGLCCLALLIIVVFYGVRGRQKVDIAPASQVADFIVNTENNIFQNNEDICRDIVLVDQDCYVRGDKIVVNFSNICNPAKYDWIAVYDTSEDPLNLSNYPEAWVYTCGDKGCETTEKKGTVTFTLFEPGSYQVHLIRDHSEVFEAYASSITFEVQKTYLDCPAPLRPPPDIAVSLP